MSNYTKATNFTSKDTLAVGNPLKIIKGTEFDVEFNAIADAVATKANIADPTFSGVPAAPTATAGTNTTQLATTAFVTAAVTAYDTALTVSTSQIEDDAVTSAKIALGAVTNLELATDAVTQVKIANDAVGTAEIINANVTPAKLSQPLTQGTAVATTSGTAVNFTSIPSWVKRITVMFNQVSGTGSSADVTSNFIIQLGDSGGIETSGYSGGSFNRGIAANNTIGFDLTAQQDNTQLWSGSVTITNLSGNTWCESGVLSGTSASFVGASGGSKTLSATLDRIRITIYNGTDTFDNGSVNILYE